MTTTANYNIELLAANQAQPDVTLNEAVVALDAAAHAALAAGQAAAGAAATADAHASAAQSVADQALLLALLA